MRGSRSEHLEMRDRAARAVAAGGHHGAPRAVAAERRVDGAALGVGVARHERQVLARDLARAHHRLERAVGLVGAGHHEQPGRVLVEPVDDARPLGMLAAGRAAGQQLGERADRVWPAAGWVTSPAGLSTTIRYSSSKTTANSAPAAGSGAPPAESGSAATRTRSPSARRWFFARARPSTVTRPASISRCAAARERAAPAAAR